jgi:hypothetical protein
MSEQINKQDITAGYRAIKNGSQYDRYFSKPETVDRVIIEDGEVDETVDLMKRVVWKYIDDTKRIAQFLKASTLNKTCENIWTFLHDHIQYRLDKKGVEQLRRPCRSWDERKDGIDCDCFSIFVSSILTNLDIPHKFRITKYNTDQFQHVYVIVPTGKQYITIDCVLSSFVLLNGIKTKIESFGTVARSIQANYLSILNFFDNRSTNAAAESFNAKIKAFRSTFRGVRDINFFLFRLAKIYA